MLNIDYRVDEYKLVINEYSQSGIVDFNYLNDAVDYIKRDPKSSLSKIRTILEKIVIEVYKAEMGKEPKRLEIGTPILDTQFQKKIDIRIYKLMDSIRGVSNMGPHEIRHKDDDTNPKPEDAATSFEQLLQVVEWYTNKYTGRVNNFVSNNTKTGNIDNSSNIDIQSRKQSVNQTIIHGQVSGIVNAGNGTVNIINKK